VRSMAKDHLVYSPLPATPPGQVQIQLFDGGATFKENPEETAGRLVRNPDFIQETEMDPRKRFKWVFEPGIYAENPEFKGRTIKRTAPTISKPLPLTWQADVGVKMPNFSLALVQYVKELSEPWVTLSRLETTWDKAQKGAPIGQALGNQGTGNEEYQDAYYQPGPEAPLTMLLKITPGPGRYGLRYSEGLEALGSRNTSNVINGRLVFQSEVEFFEQVEDVFFYSFDTTDLDNFKVTASPDYLGQEMPFNFPVSPRIGRRYMIYLVPRQWYYFVYILTWFMVVTYWDYYMHPIPLVASWYDRPPLYPTPYTGENYMGEIYGGRDDRGVYEKVMNSPEFVSLQQQIRDWETSSWLFTTIFVGVSDYYYRVRCFGALEGQLCGVIEEAETGRKWYVWRRTDEEKDAITLVDSLFWPPSGEAEF